MFSARLKDTDEIIEAEELKVLKNIKSLEFACVDKNCNIPLIPSSYNENNKKRPFFKKYKNQEHSPKCSYSKYLQFLQIGKTRRLTDIEFEKLEYPSQLIISQPKLKEMDTTTTSTLPEVESKSTRRISNGEFAEAAQSNRKVTSISQIVDFFLCCPYNRDVELDLLGTKAPYIYQFKKIRGANIDQYISNKIFYGVIDLNDLDSLIRTEDSLLIKLHECEKWEDNPRSLFFSKKRINPYFLKLNKSELTNNKISRILSERDTVLNQSKNDFFKNNKKEGVEAYVFFLGRKPNIETPYVFEAINGFVSFRYAKVIHPEREN
jgi:hypothetical protein